ncbi:hypothetical protein [Rhizobium sullae]|uniref:hypothetical protein n=1 Tax=Rhizobium sullae TaxID=50338 RepID=UPI0018E23592|nr:hypothetical protein [Rhizobium sullae]
MAITAAEVWRDYETDGVPSSGDHKVKKNDVRGWSAWLEQIISANFSGAGQIAYQERSSLFANLNHDVNTLAWVYGDSTNVAYNGIYRKNGASGTGSWTRILDLPFSFIIASDVGAGTANSIQATTSIPVSESALVWLNIFEANTASPVTVSFNGGSALTIKTNSGNNPVVGGLTSGMIVLGIVSGSTFRLVSDQASATVLALAEAAKDAAEAAAASVNIKNVATRAELKSQNTAVTTLAFLGESGREGTFKWVSGDFTTLIAADTAEGLYIKADAIAASAGAWVRQGEWLAHGVATTWFGTVANSTAAAAANATAIQAMLNVLDITTYAGRARFPLGNTYYTPDPSIYHIKPHVICGIGVGAMPNIDLYEIQDGGTLAVTGSALVLYGDGSTKKLVRTRRNYRASSGDAQDDPLSAGWDCQALGARFEHIRFEVYCDYTDLSQGNMGANWDVNLLVGRMNVQIYNVHTRGYPRFCHVLLDATRGIGLPEFNGIFPTDIHAKGLDGISIIGFRSNGSTGIRLLGPETKTGLLHPGHQYVRGCKINASGNPADGDTVTIGSEVFTFRTVKTYRREVLIGASAAASITNLRAEWLIGKQAPYETLTLYNNNTLLEIYSTSSVATPVSETSANLAVEILGGGTPATQTEAISDPAPYYDQILGTTVDDGRDSLGASDFHLDSPIISVAHHSGYRMSDKGADRHAEPDTVHACLHIDGFGGSIFTHKWFISGGRFESVEPFTVRLGLTGRGHIVGSTFDANITAWLSTTGGALTSADQWGKVSAEDYNTCRVSMFTHDDPSSGFTYFPHRANGNRLDTNFIKTANSLISETTGIIGTTLTVGDQNNGTDIGYTEIVGGETGQSDVRFSAKGNSTFARLRGTPSNGNITASTKTGGTGALTARLEIADTRINHLVPARVPSFTVAGVPSAATSGTGAMIYVTNESGGAVIAFSDGAAWRRVTDRAVIS